MPNSIATPAIALGLAFAIGVLPASAATPAASAAPAATPVTVKVNMARILRINAPATTVIIGNPGIADVTIQDPKTLVLTGKAYGETNLIVLDAAGNPIADTLIDVVQAGADLVTVFNAGARTSLACSPECQPTIIVGDDPGYTGKLVQSIGLVQGNAQ